jgi:hypothetical protein
MATASPTLTERPVRCDVQVMIEAFGKYRHMMLPVGVCHTLDSHSLADNSAEAVLAT